MGRYNGGALGAGKPLLLKTQRAYTTSGTFTAPVDGWITTMQMGGGGGGGRSGSSGTATGGSSAAWAGKLWRVKAGQTLTITVGAGGAYGASDGAAGGNGGATTITDGVTTVTSPGGLGGLASSVAAVLTGPNGGAAPTNADIGAAGSKSGNCAAVGGARTGGAGVDLLAKGGNATRSGDATGAFASGGGSVAWHSGNASTASTGGAGYGGPSIGATAGLNAIGDTGDVSSMTQPSPWGVPYFGGGGSSGFVYPGGGGVGLNASTGGAGGFGAGGGGAGGGTTSAGGPGGFGAGGGAGGGSGNGKGGDGYVWLEFTPGGVE